MAGLTGNANLVASSINYVINMVTTIIALLYVDRFGRRWTLIVGSISLTLWWMVCAGLMGAYGYPAPPGGLNNIPEVSWQIRGPASKAVIACSYLVVASFAPTWGPVSWIYPPELFPLRLRGKAVALSTSSNWIFNFALSFIVPVALTNVKWKTYIIFGVFCFAMTVHAFLCFPETSGKTLEEIEAVLESKTPAWKTHVTKPNVTLDHLDLENKAAATPQSGDEKVDAATRGVEELEYSSEEAGK